MNSDGNSTVLNGETIKDLESMEDLTIGANNTTIARIEEDFYQKALQVHFMKKLLSLFRYHLNDNTSRQLMTSQTRNSF